MSSGWVRRGSAGAGVIRPLMHPGPGAPFACRDVVAGSAVIVLLVSDDGSGGRAVVVPASLPPSQELSPATSKTVASIAVPRPAPRRRRGQRLFDCRSSVDRGHGTDIAPGPPELRPGSVAECAPAVLATSGRFSTLRRSHQKSADTSPRASVAMGCPGPEAGVGVVGSKVDSSGRPVGNAGLGGDESRTVVASQHVSSSGPGWARVVV